MPLERLEIFLPFTFVILLLFHIFSPTSHRSSQSILGGLLVGTLSKTVLSTVRHIISLGYYFLLEKHALALSTLMPRRLVVGSFVGAQGTSPNYCLLFPRDPNVSFDVRYRCRSSRVNIIDLGCFPFPVILNLDCGQEVTPIFMVQGTIVLLGDHPNNPAWMRGARP